jgi:hypothetical protein
LRLNPLGDILWISLRNNITLFEIMMTGTRDGPHYVSHISDHIHEWRRRRRLIKLELPDQLLAEWFTKSFVNDIGRDIAMGGVVMEEQAISRAQYLDLVYSQTGTLSSFHFHHFNYSSCFACSRRCDWHFPGPTTFHLKHQPQTCFF